MRLTRGFRQPPPAASDDPSGTRDGRSRRGLLAVAAVLAVGLVVGGIVVATRDEQQPLDRAEVGSIASETVKKAIKDHEAAPATSAAVFQQILPSVVEIETTRAPTKGGDDSGFGTGVIVNARGSILTAFHVVDGATRIRVSFVDGSSSRAEIASTDPENDIAVLTPERPPELIVPAVLGGGVRVGDEAYAVGHPLGFVGSLTSGVISGLDRSIRTKQGTTLSGLIQFDAAVNPGNSGGPLLNRGGQVVGIVTSLADPSREGYFIGLGFAVPIGAAGGAANAPPK